LRYLLDLGAKLAFRIFFTRDASLFTAEATLNIRKPF